MINVMSKNLLANSKKLGIKLNDSGNLQLFKIVSLI